jgi:predicted GIY-YIG superfamily endonuclease
MPTGSGQFCVYSISRKYDGVDVYIGQTDNPKQAVKYHTATLTKRDLAWDTHSLDVIHKFQTKEEAETCKKELIEEFDPEWNRFQNKEQTVPSPVYQLPLCYCVYKIIRIEDQRIFYIGQTGHFKTRKNAHTSSTLHKHGATWDSHNMIIIDRFQTRQEATQKESELIKLFNPDWNVKGKNTTLDHIANSDVEENLESSSAS